MAWHLAVRDLDRAVDTDQRFGFPIKPGRFYGWHYPAATWLQWPVKLRPDRRLWRRPPLMIAATGTLGLAIGVLTAPHARRKIAGIASIVGSGGLDAVGRSWTDE
jgi:hypothetical protein